MRHAQAPQIAPVEAPDAELVQPLAAVQAARAEARVHRLFERSAISLDFCTNSHTYAVTTRETAMTSGSFNDAESVRTEAILQRFNQVFLSHDPTALPDLVADDCVIENSQPAPDGSRHEGKDACIELWTQIATMAGIQFEPESIIARGDRGEIRWRLVWGPERASSVRGVNLMRVRDGRIVEAQGYVKGA
jgi:ketosteroid isomerase-like protein